MIDPKKNFLLRGADKIGGAISQTETQDLYRLSDGRLIVHHVFSNPLRADQLERVEPWVAESRFQVKILGIAVSPML